MVGYRSALITSLECGFANCFSLRCFCILLHTRAFLLQTQYQREQEGIFLNRNSKYNHHESNSTNPINEKPRRPLFFFRITFAQNINQGNFTYYCNPFSC